MRCARCGNDNPDQNRFCGMCGATLLSAPAAQAAEPVSVTAPGPAVAEVVTAPARASEAPRAAVPEGSSSSPSSSSSSSPISGPSFLGLSDPAPSKPVGRKRASLSIDPHSAPGNLEYLLDEEEPQHHWGIGKILLILIAFGLAAGFGYLRWKNQGLAWLASKKPSAIVQNSPAPDTAPPPPSSSITPDPQPPAQPPTASPQPATPAASSNPPNVNTPSSPAPAASSPGTPAPAESTKPAETTKAETPKSNDPGPPAANAEKTTSPAESGSTAADDKSADAPAPAAKPAEKPKPAPRAASPKPSAAKPAAAYDPVSEAQKYLYGRGGAAQDCEHGMRLLKPAANQANPKAMIEMGALYSAGLCAPHDLPTAYRWFALALRKDPENNAVQSDLQKLWGEMTQPERQLAIKLTQ